MQCKLNLSRAQATAHLGDVCRARRAAGHKVSGMVNVLPDRTEFTLRLEDRFYFRTAIPQVYVKGDIRDEGEHAVFTYQAALNPWLYVSFIVFIALLCIMGLFSLVALVPLALLAAFIAAINVLHWETLKEIMRSVFPDETAIRE